ncbi:glycosyltransferase family 2 protein [Siphonobacter sp. SORGH_AS_1065]|uniref:glycosyltransferase family 2 protein n=1 Tax=Siphonobacter sp. SORGH_AS_1065 TaxID=3041795 RepID=UPI00277FA2D4|nr:glycosyltransferase family 2 protein [Siphonobacter sp. SORGH_AS_1065]MDQ1088725.1 glycosyltransferase involved in cell wall biosynthesis [Siphonobacter sp. SORGH_AS_1065]
MKISVAMCTYNGSRFLREQLESIRSQSHPVDELVICDDRSKDDTIQILENFATQVPFPVHIHVNPSNLGSTKNFEKCLNLCSGDVIFCCDQDDRWHPQKVEKQVHYLQQHPEMEAVFSDAQVINDDSQPIGKTIWQEIEFDTVAQERWKNNKAYEILFGGYVVTGATLAIRRRILSSVSPFPVAYKELIHDAWIAIVLSLQGNIGFIPEELLFYRKHSTQQVGFGEKKEKVTMSDRFNRDRKLKLAPLQEKATNLELLQQLLKARQDIPAEKLTQLTQRQKHFNVRATLPDSRLKRFPLVLNEWIRGRYAFSSKDWWLPLLGDLFE